MENERLARTVVVGHVYRDRGGNTIYCGRPGRGMSGEYGNPFVIGRDGDRDAVIAKHANWFMREEQRRLRSSLLWDATELCVLLKGRDPGLPIVLTCFCSPLACHCDIMARWLNMEDRESLR